MNRIPRLLLSVAATAALAGGTLAVTGSPGSAVADAQSVASSRLAADASGGLTYRTSGGVYDFVGVPAGVTLNDPGVSSSTSVADAAAAHLARYGAAFGANQQGTTLTEMRSAPTVAGDVVRYQQNVGGLPVMGGEFAVSLRPDRELSSILAKTSRTTTVPAAKVSAATATATARASFLRTAGAGGDAKVTSLGRWVIDPSLIGGTASMATHTAWRFEVTRGVAERRIVLVDDQTGMVLFNKSLIEQVKNRIVCDNANVAHASDVACVNSSANLVGTEAVPPASGEALTAFNLGGVVYDNYLAFGGIDLTNLIGRVVDGGTTKALSQTVKWCYSSQPCPYANAFWNGSQMYYGQSYATADDVVGHEMTHGVTERSSNLIYWGQSGAMNESISDIMGEIIDHRNVGPGDSATSWGVGEDLPIGAIRNVQDPTLFNDPDKTSSSFYLKQTCNAVTCYSDEDGVHTNSGVGNHTFYLASQGGTFNGQTIVGIDTGDATLNKSAKLWLLTDQTLTSGSDYADEAAVLEQSCATLQGTGVMTAANCTAVHQATLATELRNTPATNPQPADATVACPAGSTVRSLFDSESGTPATKFTPSGAWSRNGIPGWGQVAHSAPAAWGTDEAPTAGSSSLTATSPVALPAGQPSFLFFQHWRVLDYVSDPGAGDTGFYDGGTVEINGNPTSAGTWVNGPNETISAVSGNPIGGQKAFGGDSRGYLASRLDLTPQAGTSVTPRFTMSTDSSFSFVGWAVDDIQIYTCDPTPKVVAGAPTIKGKAVVGKKLTAKPGTWTPADATFTYQWLRNGAPIAGATGSTYKLKKKDKGKKISVTVTGSKSGFTTASATSPPTKKVKKKKPHHHHHRVAAVTRLS